MWQIASCERICSICLRRRKKGINGKYLALAVLPFPAISPKILPPLTLRQDKHLHFEVVHQPGFVYLLPSAKIEITIYDVLFASKKKKGNSKKMQNLILLSHEPQWIPSAHYQGAL